MTLELPTDPLCSLPELLAVFFSYEVQDGEHIPVGGGLHIPRAGYVLAHLRDCANTSPLVAQSWCNLRGVERAPYFYTVSDGDATGIIERSQQHEVVLDHRLDRYADASSSAVSRSIRGAIRTCSASVARTGSRSACVARGRSRRRRCPITCRASTSG